MAAISLAACDNKGDETPKAIELTGGTSTSQTIYADETSKSEGIKFTALAPWTATVSEVSTKADNDVSWLKLSAYSGGAGEFKLSLTLTKNTTGNDRKAEVRIVCGEVTITIVVEQKATTKDQTPDPTPDPDPKPEGMRYVKKLVMKGQATGEITFEYDDQMRIFKMMVESREIDNGNVNNNKAVVYITYKDNIVTIKQHSIVDGVELPDDTQFEIILNANNMASKMINAGEMGIPADDPNIDHLAKLFPVFSRAAATRGAASIKYKRIHEYTYDADGYVIGCVAKRRNSSVIEKFYTVDYVK